MLGRPRSKVLFPTPTSRSTDHRCCHCSLAFSGLAPRDCGAVDSPDAPRLAAAPPPPTPKPWTLRLRGAASLHRNLAPIASLLANLEIHLRPCQLLNRHIPSTSLILLYAPVYFPLPSRRITSSSSPPLQLATTDYRILSKAGPVPSFAIHLRLSNSTILAADSIAFKTLLVALLHSKPLTCAPPQSPGTPNFLPAVLLDSADSLANCRCCVHP